MKKWDVFAPPVIEGGFVFGDLYARITRPLCFSSIFSHRTKDITSQDTLHLEDTLSNNPVTGLEERDQVVDSMDVDSISEQVEKKDVCDNQGISSSTDSTTKSSNTVSHHQEQEQVSSTVIDTVTTSLKVKDEVENLSSVRRTRKRVPPSSVETIDEAQSNGSKKRKLDSTVKVPCPSKGSKKKQEKPRVRRAVIRDDVSDGVKTRSQTSREGR